ncbi:MAG: exosortase A [Betaproteobacteria bacterium]|nr:exosortase A [Betaproteobacteria bacterium]
MTAPRAWGEALAWLLLTWIGLIALLQPSAGSMVTVWLSSDTYAHGAIILPITLWLVWRKRHEVMALEAKPDPRALVLVILLAALWLFSRFTVSQVSEHYALVGLLITSVWALLGAGVLRALLFPLAYLLFMVPSGEFMIEPLIHYTADTTVTVVRLLGIPVYRENNFFSLPSGDWNVVEACSGMRYFLSSLALGWLYAYLTYRTWWKRLAFGIAAAVTPIVANGARAALIVLLGHFSNMKLAVGVDHLIYGWVWFGMVMMAMFWIGNRWREDHLPAHAPDLAVDAPPPVRAPRSAAVMAAVMVTLTALFPLYEQHLRARIDAPSPLAAYTPPPAWTPAPAPATHWTPVWYGVSDERSLHLSSRSPGRPKNDLAPLGGGSGGVPEPGAQIPQGSERLLHHLVWYGAQEQDRELVNAYNQVVLESNHMWRRVQEQDRTVSVGGQPLTVREAVLEGRKDGQRVLVWHWWRVLGHNTIDPLDAKLRLAWNRFLGRGDPAAVVILAAPYEHEPAEAEAVLSRYLDAATPSLNPVLDSRNAPVTPRP